MTSPKDIASLFIMDYGIDCAVASSAEFSLFKETNGHPKVCKSLYDTKSHKRFLMSEYGRHPENLIRTAVQWACSESKGQLKKIVIGCFGVFHSLTPNTKGYGALNNITSHERWSDTNLYTSTYDALDEDLKDLEIIIKTDADLVALGEFWFRAVNGLEAAGLENLSNMTANPGIENSIHVFLKFSKSVNGGICYAGDLWKGRLHPVMNAVKPQRMFTEDGFDNYSGKCQIHGSCIEGMVSTAAIRDRYKKLDNHPAEVKTIHDIPECHEVWKLTAFYIARMCVTVTSILAPSLITIGGSVLWRHKSKQGQNKMLDIIRFYFNQEIWNSDLQRSSPDYPELARPDHFIQLHADELAGLHGGLIIAADHKPKDNVHPFLRLVETS